MEHPKLDAALQFMESAVKFIGSFGFEVRSVDFDFKISREVGVDEGPLQYSRVSSNVIRDMDNAHEMLQGQRLMDVFIRVASFDGILSIRNPYTTGKG